MTIRRRHAVGSEAYERPPLLTRPRHFGSLCPQPLFMSTGDGSQAESTDPALDMEQERPNQAGGPQTRTTQEVEDEDEGVAPGAGRDCVACQNAPVNRVLLPCRHTCLCDGCVSRVQHCPMCRAFVLEAFALCRRPLEDEQEGHHRGE